MKRNITLRSYDSSLEKQVVIPEKHRKSLGYSETLLKTDENGYITFKDFENAPNKIYFLGDSYVENSFVTNGKRLTDIVNLIVHNYHTDWCVFNCGVSNSSILHLFNILINKIHPGKQDCILLFPGSITRDVYHMENCLWVDSAYGPLTDYEWQVKWASNFTDDFFWINKILRFYIAASRIYEFKLIIGLTPCYDGSKAMLDFNKQVSALCVANNINFIDLPAMLEDNSHLFYDQLHLNVDGALFYGIKIGVWLIKNLVNKSST